MRTTRPASRPTSKDSESTSVGGLTGGTGGAALLRRSWQRNGRWPRWALRARGLGGDIRFEDAIGSTKNPEELMALINSAPEGATTWIEGRQRRIGTPVIE